MRDYGEIYREAFADALARNMAGNDGTPEWAEGARQYAAQFAEGEVQAARELAGADDATGPIWLWAAEPSAASLPGRLPAVPCGTCGALVVVATGTQHRRWHEGAGA